MEGGASYSPFFSIRPVPAVLRDSTSNTTTGSGMTSASLVTGEHVTIASGYLTRPATTILRSPRNARHGLPRNRSSNARTRFVAITLCATVPPFMATGWNPSNS